MGAVTTAEALKVPRTTRIVDKGPWNFEGTGDGFKNVPKKNSSIPISKVGAYVKNITCKYIHVTGFFGPTLVGTLSTQSYRPQTSQIFFLGRNFEGRFFFRVKFGRVREL